MYVVIASCTPFFLQGAEAITIAGDSYNMVIGVLGKGHYCLISYALAGPGDYYVHYRKRVKKVP